MSVRRVYESTVIINAALEDNDIDAVITRISNYIENHGGVISEVDKWGRRRLAYPINKKYNGYYVHIVFDALPSNIPIFERFLVLEDTVLRHLTLILEDELRQLRIDRALAEGKETGTSLTSNTDEAPKTVDAKTEKVEVVA
jgi:small subunit ribosomal protein S6